MRPKLYFAAISSSLLLIGGCAYTDAYRLSTGNSGTAAQLAQSGTQIPIAAEGPFIVLRARVNGKADARFLLDTGSPVIVLFDTPATTALGIDYSKARRLPGAADNTAIPTGVIGSGYELDFGSLKLSEQTLLAVPVATMQCPPEQFLKAGIDGIIGRDIFRRYVVEIDFDKNIMTLHEPGAYRHDGNGTVLSFSGFSGNKPMVQVDWQPFSHTAPLPLKMLLDTGFNGGLRLYPSTNPALKMPADAKVTGTSCGIGGSTPRVTGPDTTIHLAGKALNSVPTSYDPAAKPAWEGLIGMELLRRFNLVVDYGNNRLILKPRSNPG